MNVLVDLEWYEKADGTRMLTQLAACRTDEQWITTDSYTSLACPNALEDGMWNHVAYNGYPKETFLAAVSEEACLRRFGAWLTPSDTMIIWHNEAADTLRTLFNRYDTERPTDRIVCVRHKLHTAARAKGYHSGKLYKLAAECRLDVPSPEHCSENDVDVLARLIGKLKVSADALCEPPKPPASKLPLPKPAPRVRDRINPMYRYIYTPSSPVFHRPTCGIALRAGTLFGCTYYQTACEKHRPCKCCRPEPDAVIDAPKREIPLVRVTLLGDRHVEIEQSALVGCCHNPIHPGKLTERIMKQHDCIGKKCSCFERYDDCPYWAKKKEKEAAKQRIKEQRRNLKRAAEKEAAKLESLAALFQSYADEDDSEMMIVRLEKTEEKELKVFYVSENAFADGNRFPALLNAARSSHPQYRVNLRHIKDIDGHFVTIDEYESIRRGNR